MTASIGGLRLLLTIEHEPRQLDGSQDNAQVAYEEVWLEDTAHASGVTLEFTGVNCGLCFVVHEVRRVNQIFYVYVVCSHVLHPFFRELTVLLMVALFGI